MKKLVCTLLSILFVLSPACTSEEKSFDYANASSDEFKVFVKNASEETELPLPVSVYVFDSSDKCVDVQTLSAHDESFLFTLPIGDYALCVMAGANTGKYILPDKENASPDTPLRLKTTGDSHAELAAKTTTVTLGASGTDNLTVSIDRIVAQITASISEVPEDITSVQIMLEPLEEEVTLNGSYDGEGKGKLSFELTKSQGNVWETSTPLYVLPGADEVSVMITFTDAKGVRNYSYSVPIPVEANCKTNITASYKAGSAELSGSIQYSNWADEHQVVFEFGEGATHETNQPDVHGEMLTQGDIYKGCYILDVLSESDNQSTLLLLAPGSSSNVPIDKIKNTPNYYPYEELEAKWRFLTTDEAKILYVICSREFADFNDLLKDAKIDLFNKDLNYICTDSNDALYSFSIGSPLFDAIKASKGYFAARFVTEVTVQWKTGNDY